MHLDVGIPDQNRDTIADVQLAGEDNILLKPSTDVSSLPEMQDRTLDSSSGDEARYGSAVACREGKDVDNHQHVRLWSQRRDAMLAPLATDVICGLIAVH